MCKKNRILDKYSHAPLEAQLSMKTSLKPFVSMSENGNAALLDLD